MTSLTPPQRVWVHLFDGEQDGFRRKIELKTAPPKKFYIWHIHDDEKIENAKSKNRTALRLKLATMAYVIFDQIEVVEDRDETLIEYRYRRCESADKTHAAPAPPSSSAG